MYARHDLAWLTAAGWRQLLADTPSGSAAHAAIARWAAADWPLVARRQDAAAGALLCLGLAAPPDPASGAKLRLPLQVPAQHIARRSAPLPLAAVAEALPVRWQSPFARLCAACAGLDLRVFGSLAMQALTGQVYLRAGSDIDLLFRPRSSAELEAGSALLAAFLATLPLDGEIVFPSGQAVAWKEWVGGAAREERVLVKSPAGVRLAARHELRAELRDEREAA
jgi:phosphoribosyl-dephospho-CoA transferase